MDYMIYLLLGLLIIYVELTRKRTFLIDHIMIFHFFYFLVYVLTPIMLYFYGTDILNKDLQLGKFYFGKNPFTSIVVFLAYLFFLLGFSMRSAGERISHFSISLKISEKKLIHLIFFAYFILFLALIIFVQGEGGLIKTIQNSELYRSGVIFAKYGFLKRFFPLNTILLFYTYYKIFLEKESRYLQTYKLFFTLSLILFTLFVALNNSRGFILAHILGLYVITAIYYHNYFLKYMLTIGLLGILIIKYGDPLFYAIPAWVDHDFDLFLKEFNTRIENRNLEDHNIFANFAHPIISLETSLALVGEQLGFRYFVDFLQAIVALLPNKMFGIEDPQFVMVLNTEMNYGEKISIVLPGILALFAYSLHAVGVFIGMFFYGLLGRILLELFKTLYRQYNASIVFIYMISFTYGYFVFRGSPRNALFDSFILFVTIAVLLMLSRITSEKSKEKMITVDFPRIRKKVQ
ncbi:MAG: hypothetical protein DSZ05_08105 [Sulfurospirillum sp.]|nr:MAG: hypothetical protein DSZ05_08105 [Sulfurospirillum sp.]